MPNAAFQRLRRSLLVQRGLVIGGENVLICNNKPSGAGPSAARYSCYMQYARKSLKPGNPEFPDGKSACLRISNARYNNRRRHRRSCGLISNFTIRPTNLLAGLSLVAIHAVRSPSLLVPAPPWVLVVVAVVVRPPLVLLTPD